MLFNTEKTASCIEKMIDVTQSRIFYIHSSVFVSEGKPSAG
jgi:DNA-directed RNA polymerase specialized sigma subunit